MSKNLVRGLPGGSAARASSVGPVPTVLPGDPDAIFTHGNPYLYADTEPMIDEQARTQDIAKALLD